MSNPFWYAGPWVWDAGNPAEPFWRPPAGCGGLDLRPLPAQAQAGGTPGMGLFFGSVAPAAMENRSDYSPIGQGSWYDIKPTAAQKARIARRAGFSPAGEDLVGMILSILTDGGSPDGGDGPRPLVPTAEGRLELCCGQRHSENFRWGGFHTPVLRQQLRLEFAAMWADAQAGRMRDPQHPRRVLDYWCEKYRVGDWKEFVPAALQGDVPGPLPHQTTITDNFNRADSASLGSSSEGWSWSDTAGTSGISSNQGQGKTGDPSEARAETDLSSADNYAQAKAITFGSSATGPICRFSSAARTLYGHRQTSGGVVKIIYKRVAGTLTSIGTPSINVAANDVMKVSASGSTVTAYINGSSAGSVTDTSVTGNLRTGYGNTSASAQTLIDDFQAGDLAAAGVLYTQLERGVRGLNRGMYSHFGG